MMHKGILISLGLVLTSLVQAGVLEWEKTEQMLESRCGDVTVEAVYRFQNKTGKRVRILRTMSGCECIDARVSSESLEAGAKGELRVVFTLGDREGEQRRGILLDTDVAPEAPESLVLVVNIPTWVTLTPRLLTWNRNEPGEAKRVRVKLSDIKASEVMGVSCDDPEWEVRRGEGSGKNGALDLWIRPLTTKRASQAEVIVKVRLEKLERTYRLFAAVN